MNKKYISYALFAASLLSLILGIYSQSKIGNFNFNAISNSDFPLDRLFASYLGSLAIPIIFFLSAYHLGRYSFLKNVSNFFQTLSQSITSKFLKISLISIGCILIAWFLITSLPSGTYEDCILDGKTGRTNAELNLLKNTCRGKFPILSKLSNGKSASIYCEMNSIANSKRVDGYVDFKNKVVNIGPVNGEIVSSNREFIILKIVGDTESIWDTPDYSKIDLKTGNFLTKVNGISDTAIGICVEK
jgi:hypothetical protein